MMQSADPHRKVRVVLLWNGGKIRQWQRLALERIAQLDFVHLVLKVAPASPPLYKKPPLGWRLFSRLFSPYELSVTDLPEFCNSVPGLQCEIEKSKGREHFRSGDIEKIRAVKPDVIIRFGFNILDGEILHVAPYGVLSYHHGDPYQYRGGPPLFWEIINREKIAGAVLQRLTPDLDSGEIVREGRFRMTKHSYSDTLATILRVSAPWLAQALREIHHGYIKPATPNPIYTKAPVRTYPDNSTVLAAWWILVRNRLWFYLDKLIFSEDWNIFRLDVKLEDIIMDGKLPEPEWWPEEKRYTYSADPFYYEQNGVPYILYERFNYWNGRGTIMRNRLLAPDRESEVLFRDQIHRSYPYTFADGKDRYIIPESSAANETVIYKVTHHGVLEKFSVAVTNKNEADPSVVFYKNRWWIFCSSLDHDGSNRDLCIYWSDSLVKEFTPHPGNPVVNDIKYARPGGSLVVIGDRLFRIAQDSSEGYGCRVHILEVKVLNEVTYQQELVRTIQPFRKGKYRQGIHTLSAAGPHTLGDAKRKIFRLSAAILALRRIFSR